MRRASERSRVEAKSSVRQSIVREIGLMREERNG